MNHKIEKKKELKNQHFSKEGKKQNIDKHSMKTTKIESAISTPMILQNVRFRGIGCYLYLP